MEQYQLPQPGIIPSTTQQRRRTIGRVAGSKASSAHNIGGRRRNLRSSPAVPSSAGNYFVGAEEIGPVENSSVLLPCTIAHLHCLVVSCQVFHLLKEESIHPWPPALVLCNFIERRATPSLILHSDHCTLGPTQVLWLKVKPQVRPEDPHRSKKNTAREGIVHGASMRVKISHLEEI